MSPRRCSARNGRRSSRLSRAVRTTTVVASVTARPMSAARRSKGAEGSGDRRPGGPGRVPSGPARAIPAGRPGVMSPRNSRPRPARRQRAAPQGRTIEAAMTIRLSAGSSRSRSQVSKRDVGASRSTTSRRSRSREGSKRLVIGRPRRALDRAWMRRTGIAGRVGPHADEPRGILAQAGSGPGRCRPSDPDAPSRPRARTGARPGSGRRPARCRRRRARRRGHRR